MRFDDDVRAAVEHLYGLVAKGEPENVPTFGELWAQRMRSESIGRPEWGRENGRKAKPLVEYFGSWPVNLITVATWTDYRVARLACKNKQGNLISPLTVNGEVDIIKATMTWGEDRALVPSNNARKIKRDRVKPQSQPPVREEHVELLLRHCAHDMAKAYVLIGQDAGPRQNEIRNIRRPNIDVETGEIWLGVTKGGKPRTIVATARAIEALLRLTAHPETGHLFWNHNTGKLFSTRTLARWMERAVKRSGVELEYRGRKPPRSHGLRHGYATNAIARGVPITSVRDQMGHSSLKMTERYVHPDTGHLREAAKLFEAGIVAAAMKKRRGPQRVPPTVTQEGREKILAFGVRTGT